MNLCVKLFLFLAFIRVFVSIYNLNKKRLISYDNNRFIILDDIYYKVVLLSDIVLCIIITTISLLSSKIDNLAIYCGICFVFIIATMDMCRRISLKNGYIKNVDSYTSMGK